MIGQLVRRRFPTLMALVGITSTSLTPLLASSSGLTSEQDRPPAEWVMQLLNSQGNAIDLRTSLGTKLRDFNVPELPASVADLRRQLTERSPHETPKSIDRKRRLLRMLDILSAKDAADRRDLIRRLPVSIQLAAATDGRNGIVKTFTVDGKPRLKRFVPATPTIIHDFPQSGDRGSLTSGPSAEAKAGRWKDDGNGGCYWDPNDDGPDQCTPPRATLLRG